MLNVAGAKTHRGGGGENPEAVVRCSLGGFKQEQSAPSVPLPAVSPGSPTFQLCANASDSDSNASPMSRDLHGGDSAPRMRSAPPCFAVFH